MNSQLQDYLSENQHISNLEQRFPKNIGNKRQYVSPVNYKIINDSYYNIKQVLVYIYRLSTSLDQYYRTYKVKGKCKTKKCLVIANGPSQGMLKHTALSKFQNDGGEIISMNYFCKNEELSAIVPDWLVLTDPMTFENGDASHELISYLIKHPDIKLLTTESLNKQMRHLNILNEIFLYIDIRMIGISNISPLLPHGYIAMTAFRALSWAIHLKYDKIGIIGLDHTYPRNLYCDKDNSVLNHEIHSGVDSWVSNYKYYYDRVWQRLYDLTLLFYYTTHFTNDNIFNLDEYSLTDAFQKVSLEYYFDV